MRILAIDTALGAATVCVADDAASPLMVERVVMERGHAERLLPLIRRVMASVPEGFASLDRIAVTVGPGSFTGLRVGIAAARGLALACAIPSVGISTLAAFAAPFVASAPGIVAAAIDARHGQVYVQAFANGGRVVLAPRIMAVRAAVLALGTEPLTLVGSGAPLMAIEAWSRGMTADVVGDLIAPDSASLVRLAQIADPATAPARPLYLKAPDATPSAGGRVARRPA